MFPTPTDSTFRCCEWKYWKVLELKEQVRSYCHQVEHLLIFFYFLLAWVRNSKINLQASVVGESGRKRMGKSFV